jgi:hypothetical protein
MDTDDDFMSDAVGTSEDDFLDTQGSDDESMGEGKSLTALLVLCLFFFGPLAALLSWYLPAWGCWTTAF